MLPLRRVQQEDGMGCGVATLAMLTDQPYQRVLGDLHAAGLGRVELTGMTHDILDDYLIDRGWFVARKYRFHFGRKHRGEWPPVPWAPIHYATVSLHPGRNHFVVMLYNGAILDPDTEGRSALSDFASVVNVAGLVRVRGAGGA